MSFPSSFSVSVLLDLSLVYRSLSLRQCLIAALQRSIFYVTPKRPRGISQPSTLSATATPIDYFLQSSFIGQCWAWNIALFLYDTVAISIGLFCSTIGATQLSLQIHDRTRPVHLEQDKGQDILDKAINCLVACWAGHCSTASRYNFSQHPRSSRPAVDGPVTLADDLIIYHCCDLIKR